MRKVGQDKPDLSEMPVLQSSLNPDDRESEMIALAVNLAEKQLRDGTASPNVICHYLRLGSTRESEERKLLQEKTKLMAAKSEQIEQSKRMEDLYKDALNALSTYRGESTVGEEQYYAEQ